MHSLIVIRRTNVNYIEPTSQPTLQPLPANPFPDETGFRETILVVEDEAFVREVVCEILADAGYRVLKARNAAEAAAAFRRCHRAVRLLLTDVVLPDQNGRDLAKALRTIGPGLKTLFMSGYPENAVTRQGQLEEGMFYLSKPFSAQSLMRKVKQVLAENLEEVVI